MLHRCRCHAGLQTCPGRIRLNGLPSPFWHLAGAFFSMLQAEGDHPARQYGWLGNALTGPATAHHRRLGFWQKMLDEGKVGSFDELVARCGADCSYVSRTLRLAALAPDIVETILNGATPSGVSLRKLNRNLPALWPEQRQAVGIQA